MKKWISIFVAVSLVLLLGISSIAAKRIADKANPGKICEDKGFLSQVISCEGKDYVIYKGTEQSKFQVIKTEKDLYQYETVGTINWDRVYYLYSFTEDAKQMLGVMPVSLVEEEVWEVPLLEMEGTFFAAGNSDKEILISILGNDGRKITEYALDPETRVWRESVVFSLTEGHFAVCGTYEGETLVLAQEDGKVFARDEVVKELDVALEDSVLAKCFEKSILVGAEDNWQMSCAKEAAVTYLVPVLLVSAFLVLLFFGRRKENHMIFHLIFYSEIICMVGLLAAGFLFADKLAKQEVMETGVETGYILEEMKVLQRADGTVEPSVYWNIMKNCEGLLQDIIILEPGTGEVILAKTATSGSRVQEFYGEEILDIINQVADGNKTAMVQLTEKAGNYVVASRDFTQITAKSLMLAVISEEGMESRLEPAVSTIWNVILMLMAAVTVLHMVIFLVFASRWRKFLEGMQYVASEKQAYADRPAGNDGLNGVWAPLDTIGHNIVKLRYEKDLLYRNYYRFVPKGMDQLLKKQEVADIEIGDRNKIRGCMVHFQMENIKNVSDGEYMDVMTESLGLMHQIREKGKGFYISAGGDLLERKVFFELNPKEALSFAVELYQAHGTKEKLKNTNIIMMLHEADYRYGVSGVEDMMTPFIYSAEEKILDAYVGALAKAKAGVVLTKQTLDAIGEGFSVRYIGFVSGGETQGSIKLYECLDAYKEDKRKVMKESDVFFQKALKLFYSNDFYLARNAFNEVLKLNEQDEIARWYLFRCEYLLNKSEVEVSYGLFESDV